MLPTALRAEPAGGTATSGYSPGSKLPASSFNWLQWLQGQWLRELAETRQGISDYLAQTASVPYRVGATTLGFLIGGGLVQSPTSTGTWYVDGRRLQIAAGSGALTFAPSSVNYIHIRPRQDPATREVTPEIVVNTAASLATYATPVRVTTGVATITEVAELSEEGPAVVVPWTFLDHVTIDQTLSSGPPALSVSFPTSGASAGVYFQVDAGATRDALLIDVTGAGSDGTGLMIDHAGAFNGATIVHAGTGIGLEVQASGGGDGVRSTVTGGAGEAAVRAISTSGADGIVVDSTGGGVPLLLTPLNLDPSSPGNGAIWMAAGGSYLSLKTRSGVTRYVHQSQDGPDPTEVLTLAATSMGGGAGPTTLQSISYFCRNGGSYRVTFEYVSGRTQGSTSIPQIDCRAGGSTLSGLALLVQDHSNPNNVGTYNTGVFHVTRTYVHGGADGFVTFDMRSTTTAGTGNTTYANRRIEVAPIRS